MRAATLLVLLGVLAPVQTPAPRHLVFPDPPPDGMRYALSVPDAAAALGPRPLVLALHPGGARAPYYGSAFLRQVVEPALRDWQPIIVAPDAPTRSWTTPTADRAVRALIDRLMAEHDVDRGRVLVTGFSLGGRGTWHFAARHADLFTGAIPIAGSPDRGRLDELGTMPVHVIHSVDDELVPIEPARAAAATLEAAGHTVAFTELHGIGHFEMTEYVSALAEAADWIEQHWTRGPQ